MARPSERPSAPSLSDALASLGLVAGSRARPIPGDLDLAGTGLEAGVGAAVVLVDAERVSMGEALAEISSDPAAELVVVRAKVRGDGMFGSLRGSRVVEDLVEPLFVLPVQACGVVEIRGLFGATLVWARLRAG